MRCFCTRQNLSFGVADRLKKIIVSWWWILKYRYCQNIPTWNLLTIKNSLQIEISTAFKALRKKHELGDFNAMFWRYNPPKMKKYETSEFLTWCIETKNTLSVLKGSLKEKLVSILLVHLITNVKKWKQNPTNKSFVKCLKIKPQLKTQA